MSLSPRRTRLSPLPVLLVAGSLCLLPVPLAGSHHPPLLSSKVISALEAELSGTEARNTVQELTLYHRMRGSRQFRRAAELILHRLQAASLQAPKILEFPADGLHFYGTQRSRPAWDAEFAELWELQREADRWIRTERVASWEDRPVTLAQDSASGDVIGRLVDVGEGTTEADYRGKDLVGKLVLAGAQPSAVAPLAVERYGAAGIVSYAPNQVTAWWKEDESLVRWGHLGTFPEPQVFAFMVALKKARHWQARLNRGEEVWLQAKVKAGQHPGVYAIPTAVIPGQDPTVAHEEIVFSCHLDHQRPGANDNASGCAAILEAARALSTLIQQETIPAPRRSLRFVWPPEIEGTQALLNGQPDFADRIKAVIHLDMVGGSEATKAVFHITRSPASLPTFVNDVGEAFGRFVIANSDLYASGRATAHPVVDPFGAKSALHAKVVSFSMGSDHQVYTEGSFRIPAVYLNDWPDRYIHTHRDSVDNIDATKLKRSAFIAAAAGYFLAVLDRDRVPDLWKVMRRQTLARAAEAEQRSQILAEVAGPSVAASSLRHYLEGEMNAFESISGFCEIPDDIRDNAAGFHRNLGVLLGNPSSAPSAASRVYRRKSNPRGPLAVFGYDFLRDQLRRRQLPAPRLLAYQGIWGSGGEYAYEALNLVNGRRTVGEITSRLTSEYGPVPDEIVAEFLAALETIEILKLEAR